MIRKLIVFIAVVASTCPFYGQTAAHRIAQVIQQANNTTTAQLIPYARVLICTDDAACSGVQVYQDPQLNTPYSQPLTADSNGNYNYWVAPGCYKEQILTPGTPIRTISGVCVSAPNGPGSGSVTSVSFSDGNGFQGQIANPSTTPLITINVDPTHYLPTTTDATNWNNKQNPLGFTPENVANKGIPNGYAGLDGSGYVSASVIPAFSGDATSAPGTTVLTLPNVNSGSGVCGDATHVCQITTNAKGLTTAQSQILLNNVTTLSVGNLAPLFTANVANPSSTPSVTFTQSPVNQNSVFVGPPSGGPGVPSFQTAPTFSAANLTNFPTLNQNTTGTAANLSGTPALPNGTTATTQAPGDNSTKLATTAFVLANASSAGVTSINSTTGAFTFTGSGVSCVSTTCTFSGSGSGIGSIAWTLPSFLTASPTTISASGTQTFALANQNANLVFAGPSTGSAAAPTFRSLVAADIPTLNQNTTGTAANLSGTPALPNGTTATTQAPGDNSTKLATTAFVLANAAGISGLTTGFIPQATSATAIGNSFIDYGVTNAGAYTSTKDVYAPAFHATDTSGTGFGFMGLEGTAPSGVTGSDGFWADSTAHRLKMNNNNAGALNVVGIGTAATSGHIAVFSSNGVDIQDSGAAGFTGSFTTSTGSCTVTNGIITGCS